MKVLVACEFSGRVRDAFIARGHDAWSCDSQKWFEPSPGYQRHLRQDVRPLLRKQWDLVIAHPPCTYLCNSGVRWLKERKGREGLTLSGVSFFLECLNANAPRVCVENPIMHKYASELIGFGPTQIVQPWMFGHGETKATCLYLIGLPKLTPTKVVDGREPRIHRMSSGSTIRSDRRNQRSITYTGLAEAMAEQWGSL